MRMFRITPYAFKRELGKFGVIWAACPPTTEAATFALECFDGDEWKQIDTFHTWSEAWDIMLTLSAQLEVIRLNEEKANE